MNERFVRVTDISRTWEASLSDNALLNSWAWLFWAITRAMLYLTCVLLCFNYVMFIPYLPFCWVLTCAIFEVLLVSGPLLFPSYVVLSNTISYAEFQPVLSYPWRHPSHVRATNGMFSCVLTEVYLVIFASPVICQQPPIECWCVEYFTVVYYVCGVFVCVYGCMFVCVCVCGGGTYGRSWVL